MCINYVNRYIFEFFLVNTNLDFNFAVKYYGNSIVICTSFTKFNLTARCIMDFYTKSTIEDRKPCSNFIGF